MHDAFWQYISESQSVSDLQPEILLQSILVLQDAIFMPYYFFKRHFAMPLDWFLPWEGRRYTLGWLSRYSVRSSHVVNNAHLFAVKYHTSIPYTMNLHCTWFRHLLWHSFNPIFGSVPVVSDIFPWSPHQTSWYAISQSTKIA